MITLKSQKRGRKTADALTDEPGDFESLKQAIKAREEIN
jgi:hypothetical protein